MNEEKDLNTPKNFLKEPGFSSGGHPEFSQGAILGIQNPPKKPRSRIRMILALLLLIVIGSVAYWLILAEYNKTHNGAEKENPFGVVQSRSDPMKTEESPLPSGSVDRAGYLNPDEFRIALAHMESVFDTMDMYPEDRNGITTALEKHYEDLPKEDEWVGRIHLNQALKVLETDKVLYSVSPDRKWFHIGITVKPKSNLFRDDIDFDSRAAGWVDGFTGYDTTPCGDQFTEGGCLDFGITLQGEIEARIKKFDLAERGVQLFFEDTGKYPELLKVAASAGFLDDSQITDLRYARNASGTAYHIGISISTVEQFDFAKQDADFNSKALGWENGFNGSDSGPCESNDVGEVCYDRSGKPENKKDPALHL